MLKAEEAKKKANAVLQQEGETPPQAGLDTIINEYDEYRQRSLNTAHELSWFNRSKELIKLYNNHI